MAIPGAGRQLAMGEQCHRSLLDVHWFTLSILLNEINATNAVNEIYAKYVKSLYSGSIN